MAQGTKKHQFSTGFNNPNLSPKGQMLLKETRNDRLVIGIPKEVTLQEHRVALSPASVATLIGHGHSIKVERGAGLQSHFQDHDFSEAGAEICPERKDVYDCQVLIKVAPPTIEEANLLRPGQILISPLQIPIITEEYIDMLIKKQVIAIAMEYMMDNDGTFPLVRIMSEMAGLSAILTAAELLSNSSGGKGILLGGISGVPPAKVVILGAGVVGEFATRTALGLGARVCVFDNNIYKLMRIQQRVGQQLYTSSLNPAFLTQEIITADVVIGAIHSETGRSPIVVTEDQVERMSQGSVIIDVSIDQGGCVETSELTTHAHPTFVKHGVIHYCVTNIASRVARTASIAVSNILTPIMIQAGETGNIENIFISNPGLRHGVYTYKGCLTNEYLAHRFDKKYTNLDLLMTSSW